MFPYSIGKMKIKKRVAIMGVLEGIEQNPFVPKANILKRVCGVYVLIAYLARL